MHLHAIIPAGGAGTRLWPLSTKERPKFLLPLGLGRPRSMLQDTLMRLAPFSAGAMIVTGAKHAPAVQAQVGPDVQVVAEPSGRDSMPAIALAAALLQKRYGEVLIGSFAADQVIKNEPAFHDCLRQGLKAGEAGFLTTIGLSPTCASSAYGYINYGARLDLATQGPCELPAVHEVQVFVEKPDTTRAQQYLSAGNYLWNAGMFIVKTSVLLDNLAQLQPQMAKDITSIAQMWDEPGSGEKIRQLWENLPASPIDTVLAEPMALAQKVACVVAPPDLGWADIGDFSALSQHLGPQGLGEETTKVYTSGGTPALIHAPEFASVAVIGIPGAVVVAQNGRLLVTTTDCAQEVKNAAQALS